MGLKGREWWWRCVREGLHHPNCHLFSSSKQIIMSDDCIMKHRSWGTTGILGSSLAASRLATTTSGALMRRRRRTHSPARSGGSQSTGILLMCSEMGIPQVSQATPSGVTVVLHTETVLCCQNRSLARGGPYLRRSRKVGAVASARKSARTRDESCELV